MALIMFNQVDTFVDRGRDVLPRMLQQILEVASCHESHDGPLLGFEFEQLRWRMHRDTGAEPSGSLPPMLIHLRT